MHRIDNDTAVAVLPAAAPPGAPGFWTSGDPATETPATIADEDWFNAVQEELIYLIQQAGLAPDKTNHTQVYQAIAIMVGGGTSGFATVAWVLGQNYATVPYVDAGDAATLTAAEAYALAHANTAQTNAEGYADAAIAAAIAAMPQAMGGNLIQQTAGGSLNPSVTITPGGPGVLVAMGSRNNAVQDGTTSNGVLSINGTPASSDSTKASMSHFWVGTTVGGAPVTAQFSATATVAFSASVALFFIPYP